MSLVYIYIYMAFTKLGKGQDYFVDVHSLVRQNCRRRSASSVQFTLIIHSSIQFSLRTLLRGEDRGYLFLVKERPVILIALSILHLFFDGWHLLVIGAAKPTAGCVCNKLTVK